MKRLLTLCFILFTLNAYADSYTPGTYDETMQQGEDFVRYLTITDSNGQPANLTGRAYKVQFRPSPSSSSAFANFSTVLTPLIGKVAVILHTGQTKVLGGKSGFWDMLETAPDGSLGYLWKGQLSVSTTTTRVP